jgi:hypothetical protein
LGPTLPLKNFPAQFNCQILPSEPGFALRFEGILLPYTIRITVKRKSTGEIWADPRQEDEALWPEKFPRDALERIAKDQLLTNHVAAGQLQQRPTAAECGMFKRDRLPCLECVQVINIYTYIDSRACAPISRSMTFS